MLFFIPATIGLGPLVYPWNTKSVRMVRTGWLRLSQETFPDKGLPLTVVILLGGRHIVLVYVVEEKFLLLRSDGDQLFPVGPDNLAAFLPVRPALSENVRACCSGTPAASRSFAT